MAAADVQIRPSQPETKATTFELPQSAPLTPSQIAIVKATAPVLKEHGVTITTLFYNNMINAHPELRDIFSHTSQVTGRQPRALAASVLAYAEHVDDLPALRHAVERIAQKHVSLTVQPAQYDIVGKFLMEAIGQVLGAAATPDIVDAWTAAYGALASVFITREEQLYSAHEKWRGWRKFRIVRREREADRITSFYFAPSDGAAPLPAYLPGQYVSVQVRVPELGYLQSRQYSLSEAPRAGGAYYRVSVKREHDDALGKDGLVSNLLHDKYQVGDEVELTHPAGEFVVDPDDETKVGAPAVLISAGVGATPLLAILDSLTRVEGGEAVSTKRPLSWIHTSRSAASMPFAEEVKQKTERAGGKVATHVALREEGEKRLDVLDLKDREELLFLGDKRAEYYICGPEAFMLDLRRKLEGLGVDKNRIFLELFATGDVPSE
ncbi:Flavohemoprotein [Pleurostoma richardsiae]|uniref:nitric oxide dioxygenase n=1 Tax=Pleurostoma richardsiae TaxID=41990 RepID=A0AA38RJ82_9PEZI|nr:Flavohemoprotein [Pleurostoma richardsiae]